MPVDNKAASKKPIFALAVLKPGVILDPAEFPKIMDALNLLFPGISVIVVAEDDGLVKFPGPRKPALKAQASCRVIFSSKITPN